MEPRKHEICFLIAGSPKTPCLGSVVRVGNNVLRKGEDGIARVIRGVRVIGGYRHGRRHALFHCSFSAHVHRWLAGAQFVCSTCGCATSRASIYMLVSTPCPNSSSIFSILSHLYHRICGADNHRAAVCSVPLAAFSDGAKGECILRRTGSDVHLDFRLTFVRVSAMLLFSMTIMSL